LRYPTVLCPEFSLFNLVEDDREDEIGVDVINVAMQLTGVANIMEIPMIHD
jgi:hypothetical protein